MLGCEWVEYASEIKDELTTYKLDTYSMEPRNKYNLVYEIDFKNKKPKRFEIIEFDYEDEFYDKNDFYSSRRHVSRIIGMPGEFIEIKKGFVYINDALLDEPFLVDSCRSKDNFSKIKIEKNQYFVMVDHRKMIDNDSITSVEYKPYDSRKIGVIDNFEIAGVTNIK